MKEPALRKLHRYSGIILAPLILLQAVSGLFLSVEWMAGLHTTAGEILPEAGPILKFWDWIFIGIHYGGGFPGAVYHFLVGIGMVWLAVSGLWIYFRIRQRMKKPRAG